MSLLKSQPMESDESEQLEDTYRKLFPKIGRDFVYVDDLRQWIRVLLEELDLATTFAAEIHKEHAKRKALEYRNGLDGNVPAQYQDLIRLDDD